MKSFESKIETGLVSVIIPTYNRVALIAKAIQSALDQTYKKLEIIVVDDGSTDLTPFVVKKFENKGVVRYIRQMNKGAAAARNAGMQLARGEWIAFLDSDDFWYPWKIEIQIKILKIMPEVGLTFSDYSATDSKGYYGSYIGEYYPLIKKHKKNFQKIFPNSIFLSDLIESDQGFLSNKKIYWGNIFQWEFQGNFIPTLTVLGKRKLFLEIGGMDETLITGEDADFYLRFSLKYSIAYLDESTGHASAVSEDRLTNFGVAIRENWNYSLKKVLKEVPITFIKNNRHLIKKTLSERAFKLGIALFITGKIRESRKSLIEGIRYRPLCYKSWIILVASIIPWKVITFCYLCFHKTFILKKWHLF